MRILDLPHLVEETMPVYPETDPPRLTPSNTFERHGFRETLLTLGSHTGTHMASPAHMLRDGRTRSYKKGRKPRRFPALLLILPALPSPARRADAPYLRSNAARSPR